MTLSYALCKNEEYTAKYGLYPPSACLAAQQLEQFGIEAEVVNCRFIKPMDKDYLSKLDGKLVVTLEDNQLAGGFFKADCAPKSRFLLTYTPIFIIISPQTHSVWICKFLQCCPHPNLTFLAIP